MVYQDRRVLGKPCFHVICEIRTETITTRKTLGMRFPDQCVWV